MLAHFSHFLRIFFAFAAISHFLDDFCPCSHNCSSILNGLGVFWGRFGEGFFTIFRIFIENRDFAKNSALPGKKHYFQALELAEIIEKTRKKHEKSL